ncbi:crotonase/enoyl-CoA hydratase family protein [Verticiella sediminum]|uniref:Crotonase/enoyl-CoA hydratase family protein n=1 Tax=Verticiella sediminum TaxID=1247510 RepID=A0A556ATT3_9BURK|nr:crotonase/enoyl-CoA hydratase family protein [Verticiella sediminum]TSH95805.1 crotonase/enoyl-CoA hydratase family protein [Verticiella sediminum]
MSPTQLGSELLHVDASGPIALIRLARPAKRNAINDALLADLHTTFVRLPQHVRVAVVHGEGPHFCAGLDLSALSERSAAEGILHSRSWHAAFDQIQFGKVPVIAALNGAVVGGGLELASACHIRVAERSCYFGLPEGQRGLFVGGGGSARVPRLIGVARMVDMMLTGRVYSAEEGVAAGLAQYLVEDGEGLAKAMALAERVAGNAPLSNFAVVQALPRIADQSQSDGLFMESLMAAIAQADQGAKDRMNAFLQGRAGKVRANN